ncbi:MAG: StbA family protein [Marinobacter sp. T13-3]|nr:MAG: StbA family protein [Marinobacter sp. T13-3]
MKKPVNIAVDNGYYDHKVAYWEGDEIKTLKYPVIVGSEQEALSTMDGKIANMYESDGVRLVVDPSVMNKISLRFAEYGASRENRVLVNYGLVQAGVHAGQDIHLTTALPVRDFYNADGSLNKPLIEAQRKNMLEPVYRVVSRNEKPERVASVTKSRVLSEGVAAVIDYLVPNTQTGKARKMRAPVAVLDFGGSTFDIVTVMPNLNIRQSSSDTLRRGTYDIRKNFKPLLSDYLKEQGVKMKEAPDWMITEGFQEGKIQIADNDAPDGIRVIDVTSVIKEAAEPIVNEVKLFAQNLLPNMAEYEAVLLVGGGGLLCKPLFQDWEEEFGLSIRDEFANAKGMLKIGQLL